MLRQYIWISAATVGLLSGCERKERNVDVSPSRPAEPSVDPRNTPTNPTPGTDQVGQTDQRLGNEPAGSNDRAGQSDEMGQNRIGETERAGQTDLSREGTELGSQQKGGVSVQAAVQSIVASRCSREARCNNIGTDHKYKSLAECKAKLGEERKDDLDLAECPRGIDKKELDECLAAIQKEDCNNPLDKLSRLAACRSSDLCLSTR